MSEVEKDINEATYDAVADRIDSFDFGRAVELMTVMEKCATIGVKATSIAGLAAAALEEMNNEAKAIAVDRAEAAKAVEAEREAEAAAKRREEWLESQPKAIPEMASVASDKPRYSRATLRSLLRTSSP